MIHVQVPARVCYQLGSHIIALGQLWICVRFTAKRHSFLLVDHVF